MSLSAEYKYQSAWRSWPEIMNLLPSLEGKTILDLGCGIGDQTAELASRGAFVTGIDADDELLDVARSKRIPNVVFRSGDMRALRDVGVVDGIWCSFAAAYVPDFAPTLACWRKYLKPGGWVVLTEVDNLFGHEPVKRLTRSCLVAYAQEALAANCYDFHMGRKLCGFLELAGFTVSDSRVVPDKELSFDGPALPEVLEAWRARLNRLKTLREFCYADFDGVRDDLLNALSRDEHHSDAKVHCCIGRL